MLQDTQLIETLAHFSRERIPERLVDFQTGPFVSRFHGTLT